VAEQIERVENIRLYQMYRMSKAQVERVNGTGVLNERLLWHGTMVDAVENICLHGFNRSFCGRNGTHRQPTHSLTSRSRFSESESESNSL